MTEDAKGKDLEEVRHELKLLMNSIPGGVCRLRYDDGLILEYANEGMYSLMKKTAEEFATEYDNRYDRLLTQEAWDLLRSKIEACICNSGMIQMEYTVHYEGRAEEWRLMQATLLENGNKPILQCVVTDTTEMKRTYSQLTQQQEKLHVIAEMSGDMLFEYDIANDSMEYTKQGEGLLNELQISENYVKTIRELDYIHPDEESILQQFCDELQMGKEHIYVEVRKKYKDGQYHWIEVEGTTIHDLQGKPVRVIGRTKNIDERKEKEEALRKRSENDILTGLYNRQMITNKIENRLQRIDVSDRNWFAIIDVDNFKLINEVNGHLVGDAVLCMVADELKRGFANSLLGRIGSDEFIALIEGVSRETLEEKLHILNDTVQGMYEDNEKNIGVSCSIGVVQCKDDVRDYDTLFGWADYALYQVKQNNKNGYCIVEADSGAVPETGYLTREGSDEISGNETLISSADELMMFSLELLSNVSNLQSGLKMVVDRVCSFFDIDDVAYISNRGDRYKKEYHWSRRNKRETESHFLQESKEAWQYIENNFDSRGVEVLRKEAISHMPGTQVGSILFIRSDKMGDMEGCVAFIDRRNDRDWEMEKDALVKLTGIICNHLKQAYENQRKKEELEQKLNYDSVTGLLKYQKFIEMSEKCMRENAESNFYYVYSDFANFQYMNEVYGYTEGDKVLAAFAEQLMEFENGVYFSRVTSDHFVGLLTGEDEEQVRTAYLAMTEEFCELMNEQYEQNNLVLVSGFSKSLHHEELPSLAIDRANVARKYGKNTAATVVITYNKEIKDKSEAEKSISANMVTALEGGEFKAWLQPKVSLETGKVVGAEALVRWIRPDGSMIYPDRFIPVFEKNGFVTKVDFAVLDQILSYLREAMDVGEEIVPISVNFSRRHNENPIFVEQLLDRLHKKDIPVEYIEVELTESIFMLDMATLTNNIRRLKDSGITISIDDFGSGYSSLNVLTGVDADIIKLDKKFLTYAGDDSKTPVFVKYLVRMMKRMGYKVLAEGVETKEQLTLLHNAECDMVQGYYYARPMPIADFRNFLKEFNK